MQWLARLAAEKDDIRAALRWLIDAGELEAVGRLLGHLGRFWWMQEQLVEGRRWAEEVLAQDTEAPKVVRARACFVAAAEQGDDVAGASSQRRGSWPGPRGTAGSRGRAL